jgi:hypothetical protein
VEIFHQPSRGLFPIRTGLVIACALAVLAASSFATPTEEIVRAVSVGGTADTSQAGSNQFMRAFKAVALRMPPRELPAYVTAAINLRPDLSARIVSASIKVAVKHSESKRTVLCEMIDRIIRAAVAANPEAVLSIARAAADASTGLRPCVASSALAAAREQGFDTSNESGLTIALLSFVTHQPNIEIANSLGTGTINPANLSDLRENPVNSPEQPPTD